MLSICAYAYEVDGVGLVRHPPGASNELTEDRCRLKQFDESTVVSRRGSAAGTPPMSVKGIGNKGEQRFSEDPTQNLDASR